MIAVTVYPAFFRERRATNGKAARGFEGGSRST
jgi:hypothetical protein